MKQKNLIIVTIIVLCAVFLGEAYIHIHLGNIAAIPFIILGILLLTVAFFIIQKEVTAYLKHKETMEKESRDSLYRLLESRLYNIERYQKAIYNEAKSVRINTEELALNKELSVPSAAQASEKDNLEDLSEELKKNMERVAKAVIKHSREDNEQLVEQLQEIGRQITTNNDSRPADDPALETLEKLIQVCENGFRSLSDMALHSPAGAFSGDGLAQADSASPQEDESMDVLSMDLDVTEEEDVPDTGLDAILGEAVLEEPSDTETLLGDMPVAEEPVPDIPDAETLLADALVAEEAAPDIPDIETLMEDTPVAEEPVPDIPDIETLMEDTPDIENLVEDVLKTDDPEIESLVADALTAKDLEIKEPEAENSENLLTGEKSVEELMELMSKEDDLSAGDVLDNSLDEDLNRQLTPEEVSAMFAGSESVPKASETTPDESIDPNRQLTPEEIAAMFSSM